MTSQYEEDDQTLVESVALPRIKHKVDAHAHWIREHKHSEPIALRVNPPLKRAIDKTAHGLGLSISDFVRCALLVCTEEHKETHKEEGETT